MAMIKKSIQACEIQTDNCYARINSVGGNKENLCIEFAYYVSQELFEQNKPSIMMEYYEFIPSVEDNAPNFIKQGYEHLKTLPGFGDSVDV